MANLPEASAPDLTAARLRVISELGTHFAHDRLTVEELERRIERAYAATDVVALASLLHGLPPVPLEERAAVTGSSATPLHRSASKTLFAFMSGIVRRGVWLVPRRVRAIAFMGGVEVDLRHAELAAGVTHIRALAVMGAVVVRVPPGVRLESDGIAIMGGFEDQLLEPALAHPDAPVVRVTGFALMGGVEVKVSRVEEGDD